MQKITHKVEHHYQPTNSTCGYAALATLLSHYGDDYKPEDLVNKVEQPKDAEGTSHGSVTAQLADWCQTNGFQVTFYSSDMYILDLSWQDKNTTQIKKRLEEVKGKRKTAIMDSHWVRVYEDAYLSLIGHGANLTVVKFITTDILHKLLESGPIYVNICSTASSGKGRTVSTELRTDTSNDVEGRIFTHSIVVYGRDDKGNFLISDPWDGLTTMEPEQLVLSIEAAQIECDNQIFTIINA